MIVFTAGGLTKQLFKASSTVDVPKLPSFQMICSLPELVSRKPILPSKEEFRRHTAPYSEIAAARKVHSKAAAETATPHQNGDSWAFLSRKPHAGLHYFNSDYPCGQVLCLCRPSCYVVNHDLTEVNAQIESEQAELDNIKQEVNE